ncbi:RHS domain-containing protein [Veillonella sp.]|uniref:RHS domain-containing protein n=1 Tax=Veillonella sp. TaxID=1926307 RepID=UPI001DF245E2|nr:RHS domain-containing protein [Veillonella sp.]
MNECGESRQQTHYFHCDQIGIPREITDKNGNLLWYFNYTGWGRLKKMSGFIRTHILRGLYKKLGLKLEQVK